MSISRIAVAIVGFSLAVPYISAQTETKPTSSITDRTVTLKSEQAAKAAKERAAREEAAANPGKKPSITDRTVTLKQQQQQKSNSSGKPQAGITDRTVTLKGQPKADVSRQSKPGITDRTVTVKKQPAPQQRRR